MKKVRCIGLAALTAALCGLWAIAEEAATNKTEAAKEAPAVELPKKRIVTHKQLLDILAKAPQVYATKEKAMLSTSTYVIPDGFYVEVDFLSSYIESNKSISSDREWLTKTINVQQKKKGMVNSVRFRYLLKPDAEYYDKQLSPRAVEKIAELNKAITEKKSTIGGYVVDCELCAITGANYGLTIRITDIPEVYQYYKERNAQKPYKVIKKGK